MAYFPMFINLEGRRVILCGGGTHIVQKLQRLAPFGAQPVVITPEPSGALEAMAGIPVLRRHLRPEDLSPAPALVITAQTPEENRRVATLCREKGIPVNAVDQPQDCDFLFPALVTRGQLSIGICTAGLSPTAAVVLKERVCAQLPDSMEDILDWLTPAREEIRRQLPDSAARKAALRAAVDTAFSLDRPLTPAELAALIDRHREL